MSLKGLHRSESRNISTSSNTYFCFVGEGAFDVEEEILNSIETELSFWTDLCFELGFIRGRSGIPVSPTLITPASDNKSTAIGAGVGVSLGGSRHPLSYSILACTKKSSCIGAEAKSIYFCHSVG
jgi:hypothetical protein